MQRASRRWSGGAGSIDNGVEMAQEGRRRRRPGGLKAIYSAVLTAEAEAKIVACGLHALLPLDDCFCALRPTIRTSLDQRCMASCDATAPVAC